ncbi:MAG: nucleotidyltransferase domain-containing protein [Bacillota bacterium]|nr:nucleotidyltransferase domain-containing protein [Bacillota bacterium]HHU61873.1 nucleotidyltransferase domain-containing protein [Natronincola sp.]
MRFGLSNKTIDKIHSVFIKYPKLKQVIIYGSRAKGNFRPGSDLDLVIIGDGLDFNDLLSITAELDELDLVYKMDLEIMERITNEELLNHIERVGKIFYERRI